VLTLTFTKVDSTRQHVNWFAMVEPNAAPEWQAVSLGWRSRELMAACPLKGCVREWQECQVQGEVTLSK